MSVDKESKEQAEAIIAAVKQSTGIDYSSQIDELINAFKNYIYQGIWSYTTHFEDGYRNLFIIEENEYDQTDDHGYNLDHQLAFTGYYVFFAK